MTPAEIVAALPVLAQLGGAVADAVEGLLAAVVAERPELLGPLPPGLPEVDAARAEAVATVQLAQAGQASEADAVAAAAAVGRAGAGLAGAVKAVSP